MRTSPSTKDLARNVTPATQEYVAAAIREMRNEIANRLDAEVSRLQQLTPEPIQQIDTNRLANEIAQGLHAQIQSVRLDMQQLHEHMQRQLQSQVEAQQAENKRLEQLTLDLSIAVQRYQSSDRYALTRAQVMQAMREQEKDAKRRTRK